MTHTKSIIDTKNMNRTRTFLGSIFLGSLTIAFAASPDCETNCDEAVLENITYIEPQEEVKLNFDTEKYLPSGFDAYRGMEPNLEEIEFIKPEQDVNLDFNTERYLPNGFDAREGMEVDLDNIEFIEEKQEVELDFDTDEYLPEHFSTR